MGPRNQRRRDGSVFRDWPIGSFSPDFGTLAARNEHHQPVRNQPVRKNGRIDYLQHEILGTGHLGAGHLDRGASLQ